MRKGWRAGIEAPLLYCERRAIAQPSPARQRTHPALLILSHPPCAQVTPHADCQLQLRVLNETSTGEHLFSVSGAVVSAVAARMERGKIGQWEYDKQR